MDLEKKRFAFLREEKNFKQKTLRFVRKNIKIIIVIIIAITLGALIPSIVHRIKVSHVKNQIVRRENKEQAHSDEHKRLQVLQDKEHIDAEKAREKQSQLEDKLVDLKGEKTQGTVYAKNIVASNTDFSNKFVEDLIEWSMSKLGRPYELGAKRGKAGIDCSGLFASWLHSVGAITHNELINNYSAQHIYEISFNKYGRKNLKDTNRGDLIYLQKTWKGNYTDHIAMSLSAIEGNEIKFIDASPVGDGVSIRTMYIQDDGTVQIGGDIYEVMITKNILIDIADEKVKALGIWYVTGYDPDQGGINCGGGGCGYTASGLPLSPEYAGKIGACPAEIPFGSKLIVPGHGVVECKDRGGLITVAGEENSRGNIAKYSHLDIYKWGQSNQYLKIYLLK